MQFQEKHLIVVALISGQNFPEKPAYQLVCEAKFNNEVLSADPVRHSVQPVFEQELAWEVNKTSFRQHRLQRSALKLQFFAIDDESPVKEPEYKWYRLLHSKYKGSPLIFCGLYLDSDGQDMVADPKVKSGFAMTLSAADLVPRISTLDSDDDDRVTNSKLTRYPSDGVWHSLGSRRLSKQPFLLTLGILQTSGITSLIPTDKELSLDGQAGFYFAFELFGTSVTSRRFDGLVNNEFSTEEYNFFVRSTINLLRAYLSQLSPFSIYLYYGIHQLAKALIPVDRLLRHSDRSSSQPSLLEGTYEVQQIKKSIDSQPFGYNQPSLKCPGEAQLHRFSYTIELQSLKNQHSEEHDPLVYVRYTYPLFGSQAPVMTMPAVRATRHQEVALPEGYCSFEFAANRTELRERLTDAPLLVEVFDKSRGLTNQDLPFASATIDLAAVFTSASQSVSSDGTSVQQRYSGTVDLLPITEEEIANNPSIGIITYGLVLQDYGVYANTLNNSSSEKHTTKSIQSLTDVDTIRTTPEYQVALELELWRAAEEAKFTSSLRQREQQLMTTLAEEWHKRDSQRETLCRKKLAEYQALEDKLRQTLADLANRERQLEVGELELARLKDDILRQAETSRNEVNQQNALQVKDLESQLRTAKKQSDYWKNQVEEWQERCTMKEKEITSLNARIVQSEEIQSVNPYKNSTKGVDLHLDKNASGLANRYQLEAAQLSAQMATVTANLRQTEKRLEEMQKARQHYRQLWTQTLQEVARLRRESETGVRQALISKEAELESLRNKLLEQATGAPQPEKPAVSSYREHRPEPSGTAGHDYGHEIIRLMEERDELIGTGVYEINDPIIVNLERHIERLIEMK